MIQYTMEEFKTFVGKSTGTSPWIQVSQQRINQFAKAVEDYQWIHVDEEKAQKSIFGSTIAHGFLTLALAPWMSYNAYKVKNISHVVVRGFDRIRFKEPVKSGDYLRGNFKLLSITPIRSGGYRVKQSLMIAIQGKQKLACVAEILSIIYE
jgi:acyl dehydratase